MIHGVAGHVGCMGDDPLSQGLDVATATRIAPLCTATSWLIGCRDTASPTRFSLNSRDVHTATFAPDPLAVAAEFKPAE